MFVGAFQNGLRARKFNEYLTQIPTKSLAEVVTRVTCYINSKEINIEKKAQDAKKRTPNADNIRRNQYLSLMRDKTTLKKWKVFEELDAFEHSPRENMEGSYLHA